MGPLPKIRISRTRQAHKRARYLRLKLPHMVPCPTCNTLRLSHTVCPNCGTYKGVEVLRVEEEQE
ncbi:MAG: 50S ribosomal protein L32 [Phycisphaerae bacterium]|nr:50S ribosomal protein L32 [Phycisphaerae bacterium]NIX30170.1 50S ribosomal protein L32 [Phycisphaerae bacterium]